MLNHTIVLEILLIPGFYTIFVSVTLFFTTVRRNIHTTYCLTLFKLDNMENTMLIQITNQKAIRLLHELEELNLIKVIEENIAPAKQRLSDKYRGMISKEEGQNLNEHIKQMRSEWNNI